MSQTTSLQVTYVDPKKLKASKYSRKFFPALQGSIYELLKKDIEENGIRTPLEINGENIVLCGNERLRVALEIGLKTVPVIHWNKGNGVNQKIRVIRDNLARKAVDTRTKLRCARELRKLYAMKRGRPKKNVSSDTLFLTTKQIAKEVGFSKETLLRAEKIESSNLPEEIKKAAFTGTLSIRPTADLVEEPKDVQDEVLKIAHAKMKEDKHVSLETLAREVKQRKAIKQAMEKAGIPPVEKQVDAFYKKVSPPTNPKSSLVKHGDLVTHVLNFIKENLSCPECGEKHITWKCGHEFK